MGPDFEITGRQSEEFGLHLKKKKVVLKDAVPNVTVRISIYKSLWGHNSTHNRECDHPQPLLKCSSHKGSQVDISASLCIFVIC